MQTDKRKLAGLKDKKALLLLRYRQNPVNAQLALEITSLNAKIAKVSLQVSRAGRPAA